MKYNIGFLRFVLPFLFLFLGVNFVLLSCRQIPKLEDLAVHSGRVTWSNTRTVKDESGHAKKWIYFTLSGCPDTLLLKGKGDLGEKFHRTIEIGRFVKAWYNDRDYFNKGRTVHQMQQNQEMVFSYHSVYIKKKKAKRNLLFVGILILVLGGLLLRVSRWAMS